MLTGTVKGMTSQQLEDLDCHVILGNTYHLESRPGSDLVAELGGLHDFISWPRAMLTDSGGFQVIPGLYGLCALCRQSMRACAQARPAHPKHSLGSTLPNACCSKTGLQAGPRGLLCLFQALSPCW